jgi:hypothetical protein
VRNPSSHSGKAFWLYPFFPLVAGALTLISYLITFYPFDVIGIAGGIVAAAAVRWILYFLLPHIPPRPFLKTKAPDSPLVCECLFRLKRLQNTRILAISKEKTRIENALTTVIHCIRALPHREKTEKSTLRLCLCSYEKLIFAWKDTENTGNEMVENTRAQIRQGLGDIAKKLERLAQRLLAEKEMDVLAEVQATKKIINGDSK